MTQLPPATGRTHWPSVAVVVPNYERLAELGAALRSVSAQVYEGLVRTYVAYRPRSGVAELLDALPGPVVRLPVTDAPDRNPIALKRNAGVAATSEDLVAFLDDDDIWHPAKLRHQVAALLAVPGRLAVGSDFVTFNGTPAWRPVADAPRVRTLSYHSVMRASVLPTSSLLVDGHTARSHPFDERPEWTAVEDFDFKLRLRRAGGAATVAAPLTAIRVGSASESAGDRRHQRALSLSVLAACPPAAGRWSRRLAAIELIAITAAAGRGPVTTAAEERLAEALDGRLLGALDGPTLRLVRRAWNSPRLRKMVSAVRGRSHAQGS